MATIKKSTAAKKAPVKQETPTPKEAPIKIGRKEMAEAIREKVKEAGLAIPPGVALAAVVAYEEAIMDALAQGLQVNLVGFGAFMALDRAEATRPNPQKPGETVVVPAHKAAKFKVGARLKKAINPDDPEEEGED